MNAAINHTPRSAAMIALCVALVILCGLYLDTLRSIVSIWNSSETFAHGYIIVPISLWLIWKRRASLRHKVLMPFWAGLSILVVCGIAWLLAELADVQVVRQYAFVAMLPALVLVVFGNRLAAAMAFPLLFVLLAVPFGEIFISPLINLTADFTVWAVQASGIPVLRDGTNFSIPTGNWSVVEACSGVRYLIASFTLGCLYAYLTYRSAGRRALFVLMSIVIPVLANGLRAYMVVMLGHFSGNRLAVGVDHLIYGWLFFGLVMFLMYWIGNTWREDQADEEIEPEAIVKVDFRKRIQPGIGQVAVSSASPGQFAAAAVCALLCGGVWPAVAAHLERTARNGPEIELNSFQSAWSPVDTFAQWAPRFTPPTATLTQQLANGNDKAGLSILYYRNRPRGAGLINSENRLLADKDAMWSKGTTTIRTERIGPRSLVIRETPLHGTGGAILVWQWYWINGVFLENDYMGKLLQAKGKLFQGTDDSAALFAYAPYSENPEEARAILRRFVPANLPQLESMLSANWKRTGS